MRLLPLFAVVAVLSACGRESGPAEAPATDAPPLPAAEAAATDELGSFSARINAIAFWHHPSIPFNGLVIAATDESLVALNIEDGAEVVRIDGVEATGVDVAYAGQGAGAQAYAVVSLAENSSEGGFRVYEIDNETRAMTPLSSLFIAQGDGDRGFCLGRSATGGLLVHQMLARGVSTRPLTISGRMITSGDATSSNHRGGFVACAGDRLDGSVFAVNAEGDIYRIDPAGKIGAAPFARSGVANPVAIGIALNGLVEGGDTAACCGQVAVLNGADGAVHLFDRDDGRRIGVVKLTSSFDVQGVGAATAMGVGYGNFGAVYRDGVLALATDGDAPAIRMTPLNAVMDVLALPLGPAASPRDLNPQPEEDGFDFSLEPPPNP